MQSSPTTLLIFVEIGRTGPAPKLMKYIAHYFVNFCTFPFLSFLLLPTTKQQNGFSHIGP